MEVDNKKGVVSFVEKPEKQPVGDVWVNAGVYLIKLTIFTKITKTKNISLEL